MKFIATFSDGSKSELHTPSSLPFINSKKKAFFLFDDANVYVGFCNGEIELFDDDREYFSITRPDTKIGLSLPLDRLVGWGYIGQETKDK